MIHGLKGYEWTLGGERFKSEFPLDRRLLLHSAAEVLDNNVTTKFALDTEVSIQSHDPFEGAGTTTVGDVLAWIRTDEAAESLKFASSELAVVRRIADEMLASQTA